MNQKQEKMEKELRRVVSDFLKRQTNKTSLITITKIDLSPDFKRAVIYITVLPEEKERAGLSFITRHLHGLREYVKKNLKTRIIPMFSVEVDEGEHNRQKIDELLRQV